MDQKDYRFEEERGSLIFSESKIELELNKGESICGSFDIEEQDGMYLEGMIYSSSIRMQVSNPVISGNSMNVEYTFDSTGMRVGDVLKGNFFIVTDKGEFVLPFVAMIQKDNLDSSMGVIKNLFHFTNLAKSNWSEAVDVFYKPEFINICTGNDARYRSLYMGLTVKGNRNVNLEEFLIGINKKQKIEYSIDCEKIEIMSPTENVTKVIRIERAGWGYTLLGVKADNDFVVLNKTRLSDSDFIDNCCEYEITIDISKLHKGVNCSRITFKTLYDEYSVEVTVNANAMPGRSHAKQKKRAVFSITRYYMDYTVKKINLAKWLMMTDELLSRRVSIEEQELADSLLSAHSFLMQEKFNEAKWLLDKRVADRIEDASNELYCYYLYLNAIYSADEYYSKDVTDRIESIYNNDRQNWRIAWIIMKISEEMRKSAGKRYAFAIEQVRMGCTSPIIYLEAIKALSESPSLLMHLENEEKRVLLFGAREGILTKDIMAQISYLVMKVRNYDKCLLRIMQLIYKKNGSDEALQAVCVQLMKGGLTGVEYFEWYREAVERNFPLTRLYEAYMMSMDLRKDEPIEKKVLMYFSYQSTLPAKQNAYLYAYVTKRKDAFTEIYLSYKESIDRFILKELYAGKIDRNLAYLYTHILMEEMMTEDNMKQLASILFKHCIIVEDKACVSVVVVDERLCSEKVYPVTDGCAYVALPGSDYSIFLEDAVGNRFYTTGEYQIEKFFMPGKVMSKMENSVYDNLEFDIFLSEDNPEFLIITAQNEKRYRFIEGSAEVCEQFRGKLRLPLIRYYMEIDDLKAVDEMLNRLDYEDIGYKEYNELIMTMLIRGLYDMAMEFTIYYGPENIEPKTLVRLAGRIIERDGCIEDDKLTYILLSAFDRGKYDDIGLEYLARNYRGPIKQLRNIWKAATNFYTDTYGICEKMILQTLNTGAYIGEEATIFRQYVEGGAKPDVEMRYLSYFSHEYFVKERPVDDFIFEEIEHVYRTEGEVTDVCMLAWLMHMSLERYKAAMTVEQKEMLCEFLRILIVKKGIIFKFFSKFADVSASAARISSYTIVEYRGTPGTKTVINYVVSKDVDEDGGYTREEMTQMYGGIFVKTFLLFFGETLQYYITEEVDNVSQFTESETVTINETLGDSNSDRYVMVNDIAVADSLKDYDTTVRLMEEYKYKEYLVKSIFSPQ